MARLSSSLSSRAPWKAAVAGSADPDRARQALAALEATSANEVLRGALPESARRLCALFSGSAALTELLMTRVDWLGGLLDEAGLAHPRLDQGLRREVNGWLEPALEGQDWGAALAGVREFKQREMLRIAVRDLAGLAELPETVREISDVADVSLSSVLRVIERQLTGRFGRPHHQDAGGGWRPTQFAVIGLGKLGGQELNYSSDVDVIFVYDDEGNVFKEAPRKGATPERAMSSHQFFTRLAEQFIAEVSRPAAEGVLYRIDLRLRPEGDAGPLVRGLGSYENYYAQWGQTWERMMLIKARLVAGDRSLGGEFLEMIQPFRYPRSLSENVRSEIAGMKERIEQEVVREGELERNVKLGRGGIREIEFVVQTLQLVEAGRLPFLQTPQTLAGLEQMVRYDLLTGAESTGLHAAYAFLRRVEHRLQMEQNRQTHTIPESPGARKRLAALMGFSRAAEFERELARHTGRVRAAYDKFLKGTEAVRPAGLPRRFAGAELEWKRLLAEAGFKDVDRSFRLLNQFVNGPGYVHVSPRTTELAGQLLPRLFALCRSGPALPDGAAAPARVGHEATGAPARRLSDPDRVMARLDSYIEAYGARATLFETWAYNPNLFELLILLFDRSEFLAESAIRSPDLVDELVLSDRLRRSKSAEEVLADLRYGLSDPDQRLWIRRYHHAEFMRIGLRDILGLADLERVHIEFTALADACLQYALDVTLRRHRLRRPPFVIIGLGKLGGCEIDYGSDLDLVFVADPKAKNLARLVQLAVEVMELLSTKTEMGAPFKVDARLRPDGEKGLLVNTLGAFEEYYRQRALLWEIQTLTRTRPVAGDRRVGDQFQALAARLTDFSRPDQPLGAFTPEWKRKIAQMRERIEKERTPAGQNELAIKTGTGGLMDAEFSAQTLCLARGWQEANTLRALERARDTGALPRGEAEKLIDNYSALRQVEAILRRWSFEGETVLPTDAAAYRRVAIRCGCESAEEFRDRVAGWRRAIREVYDLVLGREV